jgi:hypothetical protein
MGDDLQVLAPSMGPNHLDAVYIYRFENYYQGMFMAPTTLEESEADHAAR